MKTIFEKTVYRFKSIGIRVTPDELAKLHQLSNKVDLSISEIVRKAVNEFAQKAEKIKIF